MNWDQIVDRVTPYVVKIETPTGDGTGFLFFYNDVQTICGIATAAHVVSHADEWKQPIRIRHYPSDKIAFLNEPDRMIFIQQMNDSAVVLFPAGKLELPKLPIHLLPTDAQLPIGVEVGWLGFPAIQQDTLCFFSGTVSARKESRNAYLIDGVAINGVSGGPVLYSTGTEGVQIVGIITAYMISRARGEALPGLCFAQDVSHFHEIASKIRSLDEADRQEEEAKRSSQQQKQVSAEGLTSPSPE